MKQQMRGLANWIKAFLLWTSCRYHHIQVGGSVRSVFLGEQLRRFRASFLQLRAGVQCEVPLSTTVFVTRAVHLVQYVNP